MHTQGLGDRTKTFHKAISVYKTEIDDVGEMID
jgi:hypothetical protein